MCGHILLLRTLRAKLTSSTVRPADGQTPEAVWLLRVICIRTPTRLRGRNGEERSQGEGPVTLPFGLTGSPAAHRDSHRDYRRLHQQKFGLGLKVVREDVPKSKSV